MDSEHENVRPVDPHAMVPLESGKMVRIFISSPNDVKQERERAREVIESLRRRYARHFALKPVFWEDLPLQPEMSFQQGIDAVLCSQGVDIAVFILWTRLGTPLGAFIRKADGSPYRSGTEREYDLMLQARALTRETEGVARPSLLVYTRRDDASFAEVLRKARSSEEHTRLLNQKKLVDSFLTETFHDQETDTNIGAYFSFDRPVTFSQRLRTHLQALLDDKVGNWDEVIWDCDTLGPPFLGLEAFQQQHAEVFFGREQETSEARNALKEQAANGCAFLLISGASGSGKSSLVRAGLLPEIITHELDDQISVWRTWVFTPSELGTNPIRQTLIRLAEPSVLPELLESGTSLDEIATSLATSPEATFRDTIHRAAILASEKCSGLRVLIVIDQLEEIFTTSFNADQRTQWLSLIEEMARSRQFWIVATVRSDFYPQIQQEPSLVRMKEGRGFFDLLAPSTDAIQRLIEEPARLAGLRFEMRDGKSLAGSLLHDASAHPELLPMLEFLLLELYARRDESNHLTFAAYEALGGVEGALARRAEETFANLPAEAQQSLAAVLESLVTLSEGKDSTEQEKAVRQHAPLATFATQSSAMQLIEAFTAARLFTSSQSAQEPSFTLSHEALLRVWPRAIEWRSQNSDFLRARARVIARMKEGSPLLKGDPLYETARAFLIAHPSGFSEAQQRWIDQSIEQEERAQRRIERRRKIAFAALALLSLAAVISAIFAHHSRAQEVIAKEKERNQREISDAARNTAESIVSNIMGDLGNQLRGLNQFTILEPASAASLRYFEQIPDSEKNQEAQKITADLQTQRAEILYRLGRFKEAVDVLKRARPYFANPQSAGYSELQIKYIDSQLSKCELQIGLTANARAGLEGTSDKIKAARKNIAQVTESDLNLLLIAAVASIWVELVDNQLPAAQELADEAHALLVEYESANPGVKDFALVPHHCKLAEQRSLTRLLQNNVEDLPSILQPQIDRARSLLSSTATTSQQRSTVSYLGRILGLLGDYHMFRSNIAEARKLYQESYDLLQRASGDKSLVMPADEIHSDVWLGFAQVRMGIISLANPNRNMPQAQSHFANAKKTLDAALLDQKVDQEMGKTMMRVIKNAAPLLMQNTASLSRESKIYLLQTMMEFQQRY